jgi:tetratricopeptide (TPR) repeat protein
MTLRTPTLVAAVVMALAVIGPAAALPAAATVERATAPAPAERVTAAPARIAATVALGDPEAPPGNEVEGSEDPAAVLSRANEAYAAGDFRSAAAGYRALLAAGHRHALLHYNLGNAYLRQGELGRAIASYRRAAAGAPRHQDVRANLAYARKNARDAVAPPESPMVWRTVFAWHYALAPAELWLAAAVLNVVLWSLLSLRLWRRHEVLTWAAAVAGLLLLACGVSLGLHRLAPSRVAVVVPREVDVRSGLRDDTVLRFKLHAGSEVVVREERDGWLRIALPDGEQGWIEAAAAEVVEL